MWGTLLNKLKLSKGSILSAPNQALWGGNSWSESAPFFPTSSQSKSRFGSRIEGKPNQAQKFGSQFLLSYLKVWIFLVVLIVGCCAIRTWIGFGFVCDMGFGLFLSVCAGVGRSREKRLHGFRLWTGSWQQWTSCWWRRMIGCRNRCHSLCVRMVIWGSNCKL